MSPKNPLFIVNKKSGVVQQSSNLFDALIKKLGIDEFIQMIKDFIDFLLKEAKTYVMLTVMEKFLQQIVETIQKFKPQFKMG